MPKFFKCLLLIFMSASVGLGLQAQNSNKLISGKITDDKGSPLQGATVVAPGSKKSAVVTDASGAYIINVPAATTSLIVTYVGMQPVTIAIEGRTSLDITLAGADSRLSEVVVIGYGTKRRADISSAISSVSEKDIKGLPVAGIDQALQGKVSGVSVSNNGGQPGGGVSVRVRGITSVNGNEPLYVVDGVPLNAQTNSLEQNVLGGGSGSTGQSALATLNPSDIASIDILKDASAQAIYGSRAANGVILITTKKGKQGSGKIGYDTYYSWQEVPRKLSVMNLRQNANYVNSLVNEIRAVPGSGADSIAEFKNPAVLGTGTDWQDEIYQIGGIQSHQLSFSGGQEKSSYYFSGGYFDQIGTLIETKFRRYNFRMSIDQQIKPWLKAGINTNLSRSNQKIGLSDGFDAVTSVVLYNSPAASPRDIYGNFLQTSQVGNTTIGNPNNPVALASVRDVRNITSKAFGNIYTDINFLKNLVLRTEFNYDFSFVNGKAYQPFIKNDTSNQTVISPSRLREERNNSLYWAFKTYLSYNKDFGKHSISTTLGHEAQASRYDYIQVKRDNLVLNLPSLSAGAGGDGSGEEIGAGAGDWKMESYFARLGYTFNNRYSVTGTFRADGSSVFGPNNRWGYFPAASASWTVTNEKFAANIKAINYLKIRVGVGTVGNQEIGGQNTYTSNIRLLPLGPFGPGGLLANVENPNSSWESVLNTNIGVDLTFLNRRVDLSVDVYKKVTTDMLLSGQYGAFSGIGTAFDDYQAPRINDGQMTNKGIDLSLTTYNIQGKDFNWKTSVVFSHYKNKLDFLNTPDAVIKGEYNEYGTLNLVSLSRRGLPMGSFYGYVTDGIFRDPKELNNGMDWGLPVGIGQQWLGDVRFKDLNGDNKIDDKDVTEIGNPNPKFTYGMTNTVNYKSIDLSVFLTGSYGAKIFNYSRRQTEAMNSLYNNQLTTVLDRYSASNPNGTLPRYNQWHNNNLRVSDRYIEDGSYLRIQNISLGYNLPKSLLAKAKVTSARFYVAAQNIKTFTNYSGYDPELGAYNNSVRLMNIDNGHYPNPRSFTVGANVEF